VAKKIPELSEEERRRLQRIVDAELPPLPNGDIKITKADAQEAWDHFLEVMKEQGIDLEAKAGEEQEG
jgi:hypothetical protein